MVLIISLELVAVSSAAHVHLTGVLIKCSVFAYGYEEGAHNPFKSAKLQQ